MSLDWPIADSTPEYTIKDATSKDFGWTYDVGLVPMQWPAKFKSYNTHEAFNAELARIADIARREERPDGLVTHVAAVQPYKPPKLGAKASEDRHIVQSWDSSHWKGSWTFAAVFDGHAGEEVSEYLVSSFPGHLKSDLEVLLAQKPSPDPHDISQLLEEAFQSFDKSMVDDLFSVLPANYERLPDDELRKVINDQHLGGVVYNACIRCMRGSTAIVTLINPEKLHLWTANLGDCQAVLAAYSVDAPDDYKTYLLSNPHNPRVSEREVKRVTSEHPEEPAVIMNHRILGALAVSRAFGDFCFKLPIGVSMKVFLNANPGFRFRSKVTDFLPRNLTPPYVSATPEVTHRELKAPGIDTKGQSDFKHHLILCSDGLTDQYDMRGFTREGAARQIGRVCVKPERDRVAGLQDNLGLHLVKDSLGDNLEEQSKRLTTDLNFQHLDDITVLVLSW